MALSEFDIISRVFAVSAAAFDKPDIVLGIGDDAALVNLEAGQSLAVSTDVLVADVHFPALADASDIAYRALAVNLSDLAAMAATPLCFTLGLVLPEADANWLQRFADGLAELAVVADCALVGGDVTRGPITTISIQVQGAVDPALALRRSGAAPGDQICVTGQLGEAALALLHMGAASHLDSVVSLKSGYDRASMPPALAASYHRPQPRLAMGQGSAGLATAAIDLSDGLFGDLQHILRASGVGARLEVDRLPISAAALSVAEAESCRLAALFGGDDYELCLTVAPEQLVSLKQKAASLGLPLTRIGEITEASAGELVCVDASGEEIDFDQSSYRHFF